MSSWCTYYVTHCVTTHHTTSLLMSLRLDHQFDPTLTYPSTMHCPNNTASITPGHNDWLTFFQHVEHVVQANGFNNCPPSYSGQENRLRGKGFRDPHVFSANENTEHNWSVSETGLLRWGCHMKSNTRCDWPGAHYTQIWNFERRCGRPPSAYSLRSEFKIQVDHSNLPHMPKAYDRQICIRHMIADNNNKNKRMWVTDKRIDNIQQKNC